MGTCASRTRTAARSASGSSPVRGSRAGSQLRLALAQRLQDRHQEERIALGFAVQPLGQPGLGCIAERRDQLRGVCRLQPRQRQAARVGLAAQALDPLCQALVAGPRLRRDRRRPRAPARCGAAPGQVMQHLRAGLVGPLHVVHHQHRRPPPRAASSSWPTARDRRAWRASGKSPDSGGSPGKRSPISGTSASSSASDTGAQLAQRGRPHAVERARDQVDHRLVGHGAFDLVALGGQQRQPARLRIARTSRSSRALADAGLAFDQHRAAAAFGQLRTRPLQLRQLVAAADEGRGLGRRRGRGRRGRRGVRAGRAPAGHRAPGARRLRSARAASRKAARSASGTASVVASRSARRRDGRRSSDSILRIENTEHADALRQRLLRQVQRLAAAPQPVAEGMGSILHASDLTRSRLVRLLSQLCPAYCPALRDLVARRGAQWHLPPCKPAPYPPHQEITPCPPFFLHHPHRPISPPSRHASRPPGPPATTRSSAPPCRSSARSCAKRSTCAPARACSTSPPATATPRWPPHAAGAT